jgi:hypothetical protein
VKCKIINVREYRRSIKKNWQQKSNVLGDQSKQVTSLLESVSVFMWDQSKQITSLLESDIEHKIIIKYRMEYKCTDLNVHQSKHLNEDTYWFQQTGDLFTLVSHEDTYWFQQNCDLFTLVSHEDTYWFQENGDLFALVSHKNTYWFRYWT